MAGDQRGQWTETKVLTVSQWRQTAEWLGIKKVNGTETRTFVVS